MNGFARSQFRPSSLSRGVGAAVSLCLIGAPLASHGQTAPDFSRITVRPTRRACRQETQEVLVNGSPALTGPMVERYTEFVGWLLEIPFTPEQRDRVRTMLIDDWRQQKTADVKSDLETLATAAQLQQRTPDEREVVRRKIQPQIVQQLKADTANVNSQWVVSLYEALHPPIAPGNPPLTRQNSDALADVYGFLLNQAAGKQIEVNAAFKAAWSELMIQRYATLTPTQQNAIAHMPEAWAEVRYAWNKASEPEREKLRAQWRQTLQASAPGNAQSTPMEKAVKELTGFTKRAPGTMSPAELKQAANDCSLVARELRREGGEKNLEVAAQADRTAQQFRAALQTRIVSQSRPATQPRGASAAASTYRPSSSNAYAAAMAQLQRERSSYNMMMNMNMMRYATSLNISNNIGNTGYHYEYHPHY